MTSYILRQGKNVPADEAFHAWTSGDLDRMVAALRVKTNPIDRHYLLMGIVGAAYKKRAELKNRELCLRVGRMHLSEFSSIAPALRLEFSGQLPRVSTHANLATVLTEDGLFDEAIATCEAAIKDGLHDGTVSGFEGRIARIRKKARQS